MPNPNNPVFPAALATDLDLMVATNRALSTLTNAINSSQTQITVVDGTKFQVPCLVQIDTEIIKVGSLSGNNFMSCVRGFAFTSPASHGQNADVKGYVLSYHHNQLAAEIKAIELGLGVNFGNTVMQYDYAGGPDIGGVFSNLYLRNNGVPAGTYGGFDMNILLSVDSTGRITSIQNSPGNINYPIIYKAAIVQGPNAVLGFSFANTNAPNAQIYDGGSGLYYAVAQFTQGNDYWVQDHFYLPDDFDNNPFTTPGHHTDIPLSMDVYWRTPAITGAVRWQVQVGALRAGVGPDVTWSGYVGQTTVVQPSANQTQKTRITSIPTSGLQPGDELFFQFGRNGTSVTDTAAAVAELISIKFNMNRDFALVQ